MANSCRPSPMLSFSWRAPVAAVVPVRSASVLWKRAAVRCCLPKSLSSLDVKPTTAGGSLARHPLSRTSRFRSPKRYLGLSSGSARSSPTKTSRPLLKSWCYDCQKARASISALVVMFSLSARPTRLSTAILMSRKSTAAIGNALAFSIWSRAVRTPQSALTPWPTTPKKRVW
ncbi:MAG: Uncharacterised protein [Halieaceae bacterium]|nr:MAG: Uncharacterised protein [Halieaceae bacterium]